MNGIFAFGWFFIHSRFNKRTKKVIYQAKPILYLRGTSTTDRKWFEFLSTPNGSRRPIRCGAFYSIENGTVRLVYGSLKVLETDEQPEPYKLSELATA